jgi:hypothetical protein
MLGYLFVAERQLHRNGVVGTIIPGVPRVFAWPGTFAKKVHAFHLAKEIVYHLTCGCSVVGALGEVIRGRLNEGRSDLRRDSSRVKEGGLTQIQVIDDNGFFSIFDSIREKVTACVVTCGWLARDGLLTTCLWGGVRFPVVVGPTVRNLLPLTAVDGDTKGGLFQCASTFFSLGETETRDALTSCCGSLTFRISGLTIFGDSPFGVIKRSGPLLVTGAVACAITTNKGTD